MMKIDEAAPAAVLWDMNSCPVPDGYDVCQVGPCIKSELEKLGCHGPININAIGELKGIPAQVLQSLSSSGIFVRYIPFDAVKYASFITSWLLDNRTPGTVVLIMDSCRLKQFSWIFPKLKGRGFTIVVVYPEEESPEDGLDVITLPWKSLLKYAKISETSFGCTICYHEFPRLADFTMHLDSEEHAQIVGFIFFKPPENACHDEETSEEDEDLDEPALKKQET